MFRNWSHSSNDGFCFELIIFWMHPSTFLVASKKIESTFRFEGEDDDGNENCKSSYLSIKIGLERARVDVKY